jgi:hypothetical protein
MRTEAKFMELPLHDATLESICFDWQSGTVSMNVHIADGSSSTLQFSSVKNLEVPRALPWGPSASINSQTHSNLERYEIELQSGDRILVVAANWSLLSRTEAEA